MRTSDRRLTSTGGMRLATGKETRGTPKKPPSPGATRGIPPARVASLGVRALFLGALALTGAGCDRVFGLQEIVLPNYYPCDCQCSAQVTTTGSVGERDQPGNGKILATVPAHTTATILDGPVDVTNPNGDLVRWWQLQWDMDAYPPGWVREAQLALADQTSVSKTAKACLPPDFSPNPTISDLQTFCTNDVASAAQVAVSEKLNDAAKYVCQCAAVSTEISRNYDASCDAPCSDPSGVCLVAGSDPPDPTPDPISTGLFEPVSVCEVAGEVDIDISGHKPIKQPMAQGSVQIHGRPCTPGEDCLVGMSYQLTGDDIEFDSGSIFADDPKFVDLSLSGATQPDIIDMGTQPILGFYLGEVETGTAFTSGHGRRSGSSDGFGVSGVNSSGLALAMNWESKACRVAGELVGKATNDDDSTELDATVDVDLGGTIVNQPPHPNAGADQTVECTSTTGADVTLDGSGSTDPDDNISFYVWRVGSATGSPVTTASANPVAHTHQALGEETYDLQVVDRRVAADHDAVTVSVADTTPPEISCNAPATIVPNDVPEKRTEGISFTATADDTCTGVTGVVIESFSCTKPASCIVGIEGDTITIFDSGGVGDTIQWLVSAQDAAGNKAEKTCQLDVVKKTK